MNLGIIFPLVIYLAFVFGAAIYAYVKRQKGGDFLSEYYVGNRSMTGAGRVVGSRCTREKICLTFS